MSAVQNYLVNMIKEYLSGDAQEEHLTEIDHLVGQASFSFIADDEQQLSLHDSFVTGFSQKRKGNMYAVRLSFNAFVYIDGQEVGKRRLTFCFDTSLKLHHLNNREIYAFVLWRPENEMGFAYWKPTPKHQLPADSWRVAKLKTYRFKFANLTRELGPFIPY